MIDYDQQILESVAVRRNRLLRALLFSDQRRIRRYDDGIKQILISAVVAAVLCAGCVGFSFLTDMFADYQQQRNPVPVQAPPTSTEAVEP
ncbi:hypothetical protein [Nesterenkonia flava]|uniref:DUF3989 domain-containing protein n=1 Tax=Nesterenkonia flava TaxID=469799 RepID=A0ABU1FRS5_9MICC|nr:hypothetical protein [Nesterenkonia flava]MDR5710947.1 hypothetical protein [Nesterenkonia flava]